MTNKFFHNFVKIIFYVTRTINGNTKNLILSHEFPVIIAN